MKKFEIAVIVGLVLTVLFSIVSFGFTGESLQEDVLRLHVLANSDSEEDQQLKLKVRDAIIAHEGDIFETVGSVTQAKEQVIKNYDKIREVAEKTIRENGYDYTVSVKLERTYFEIRRYSDFTLPAGYYEALRVVIGEGKGHNWWCVMYPPLCLNSAEDLSEYEDLSESEKRLIKSNPDYDIRFKGYEIYKKIVYFFKNRKN